MQCTRQPNIRQAGSNQAARLCAPVCSKRALALNFRSGRAVSSPILRSACRAEQTAQQRSLKLQATARPSVYLFGFGGDDDGYDEEYTVAKVTIGMFGDIRKLQKDMERCSELYDTEDEESLHFIMQETVTKILRNIEYCGYAASAGKVFRDLDEAERKFNQVSMEERSKFKEETYTNVDGRRRTRALSEAPTADNGLDNWLAVTLVVALEGKITLPRVGSVSDLRKALTTLGSVSPETLLAFELLWTPQAEGDSYSKDELMTDFPTLALL